MKLFLIVASFLIISNFGFSQAPIVDDLKTIHLWPNEVPGENDPKHKAVKTDNTKNNVTRLTDVTDPTIEIFEPEASIKNGASIIVCPGGGYNILAIDLEGYEVAQWLNSLGYTAFVLQYRVPQKREGALMDVQRALKIVRSSATHWNLNPNKIGVLGFSAGASLAARASTNFTKETYPKNDSIDSFSSRPDFAVLIYPAYLDQGENNSITPELTLTKNTPPMFLFATADDPYANSALVMASSLRNNKNAVELHLLPNGGHGYGLRKGNYAAETWPILVEKWLEKNVKTKN